MMPSAVFLDQRALPRSQSRKIGAIAPAAEEGMPAVIRARIVYLLASAALLAACAPVATSQPDALYRINHDGTDLTRVLAHPRHSYWGPAWSPDGTQIVLSRFVPGAHNTQLYLVRADGTAVTPLTQNGRNNYFPAWSPDGRKIAFLSQAGDNVDSAEIYTITVDTRRERQLTRNTAQEYGSSWSPDGRVIVFGSQRDGSWQIYTMDADGRNQAALPVAAHGNAPVWAPDGRQIAFTSDRDGDDDIYVMDRDGRNQRNLTQNDAWDDQPAWAPDGRTLAFTSDRDGAAGIYTIEVATGEVERVTSARGLVAGFASWSVDSQQLVFHGHVVPSGWRSTFAQYAGTIIAMTAGAVALGWLGIRWWRHAGTDSRGRRAASTGRSSRLALAAHR